MGKAGEKRRRLLAARGLFDGDGVLADAAAEVVEFGAADLAALGHFDFGNEGAVEGVDALDAFAVAQFAHGDGLAFGAAAFADDDAGKNLDAFFAAFDDSVMDLDGVTDIEFGGVRFHLLTLDLLEDIHGGAGGAGSLGRLKEPASSLGRVSRKGKAVLSDALGRRNGNLLSWGSLRAGGGWEGEVWRKAGVKWD